jgi:hypothetical protein
MRELEGKRRREQGAGLRATRKKPAVSKAVTTTGLLLERVDGARRGHR